MRKLFAIIQLMSSLPGFLTNCGKTRETAPTTQFTEPTVAATTIQPTEEATQPTEPAQVQEVTEKAPYLVAYETLSKDLKRLAKFRLSDKFTHDYWYEYYKEIPFSDQFRQATENLGDMDYHWSCMVIEMVGYPAETGPEQFGYILYDVDDNGTPELFFVGREKNVLAIFTYRNGYVILLDAFWSRYRCLVTETGDFYCWGSSGAADNVCEIYTISPASTWTICRSFGSESDWENNRVNYFELEDGVRREITEARYLELCEEYGYTVSEYWLSQTIHPLG